MNAKIIRTPQQVLADIPTRPDKNAAYGDCFGDVLVAHIGNGQFQCRLYMRRYRTPFGNPLCYLVDYMGSGISDACHSQNIDEAHNEAVRALESYYEKKCQAA